MRLPGRIVPALKAVSDEFRNAVGAPCVTSRIAGRGDATTRRGQGITLADRTSELGASFAGTEAGS